MVARVAREVVILCFFLERFVEVSFRSVVSVGNLKPFACFHSMILVSYIFYNIATYSRPPHHDTQADASVLHGGLCTNGEGKVPSIFASLGWMGGMGSDEFHVMISRENHS